MTPTTMTVAVALAIGAIACAGSAQAQQAEKLYLFNWTEYMDPEIIEAFEAEYDVEVVQSYFNSLPEMTAKLNAGGVSQYDIIVPSGYYVPRLIQSGLVQKLDKSKIPNLDNLMPEFADPAFDPGAEYSVAYQWGISGIVYDTETFPDAPKSWSLLFDPEVTGNQPFSLMGDGQVSMGAACAYLGAGYDCNDPESWKAAARLLLATKHRNTFSGFTDGTPTLQQIQRGVIRAGLTYNGDYLQQKEENPEAFETIDFMVPEEGTEMWVDSMMIPAQAPHPELAHEFINFILDAKIGAQLSNYIYYASPNQAAVPELDPVLTQPPVLPTDEDRANLAFTPSLDGQNLQIFQQLWTEVQSR
ncbi:ABC transporter substrate-binding protein [Salinicola aestuarinus]|uniref:ABC transporter substrate-binding protein n=1 Tax=Salinicola aestuarinus TaxID=1949082 RepID=UPI000DA1A7AC|nr:spermidine/putrescine ABC transporter substrate-binding protein [Salinicola aestuarinus]